MIIWRFGKEGYGKKSSLCRYYREECAGPLEITHINGNMIWLRAYGLTSWAIERKQHAIL